MAAANTCCNKAAYPLVLFAVKSKFAPFVENVAESTAACLLMMVQGQLTALTLGHWLVASETGLIAGSIAAALILLIRTAKRWVIAALLGSITVVVDFFVHRGELGPIALEALLTGLGAAVLSYLVGGIIRLIRARRSSASPAS